MLDYLSIQIVFQASHAWQKLPTDRFDPDFIERRRVGLEASNLTTFQQANPIT